MEIFSKQEQDLLHSQLQCSLEQYQLTEEQLSWLYERKFFKVWVPRSLGGLELDFVEGLHLLENLAYHDGSLAWTVTLCAGANLFVGYIEPDLHPLFKHAQVCLGGSGYPSGKAIKEGSGYILNGRWNYATGAPHLSHFTLVAEIWENGQALLDENNQVKTSAFFVDSKDVEIIYDWNTLGLESTASHSFTIHDLWVEANRAFTISIDHTTLDQEIYKIPFSFFAEATLLVNYIGMFRKMLDLVKISFEYQSSRVTHVHHDIDKKNHLLHSIQQSFEKQVLSYFQGVEMIESEKKYILQELEESNRRAKNIVKFIKRETAFLFPYCGIYSARKDSEINTVFRNIFTASQHTLLLDSIV